MQNKLLSSELLSGTQNIHFIGIGGSGMIGLVQILNQLGLKITGSDVNDSDPIHLAKSIGIEIALKQIPQNIKNPDLIIYTSAILQNNPELLKAKNSKIRLVERNDLLGSLSGQFENCVCISGTHGKTTTTGMVIEILKQKGIDLSALIGGNLKSIGGYGRIGHDDIFVCEACEFENHFLKLRPSHSIVLNIDYDHMEFFKTIENLKNSFKQFCDITTKCIIFCGDDENVKSAINPKALQEKNKTAISFGISKNNNFFAKNIKQISPNCIKFNLVHNNKEIDQPFQIFVPGKHNILNALAAIALSHSFKISFAEIAAGLKKFRGVKRRFEIIGKINGITVVDDYAHHPNEITATLKAAKNFGYGNIWAIHQPFTYSRTQMFLNAFAQALQIADHVILTPILGSREKNLTGITSQHLAEKIKGCVCLPTQQEAAEFVIKNAKPGDLAITLGCGDIYKCAKIMVFGKY